MQLVLRTAVRWVDWPLRDQIVPVIRKGPADCFGRSTVEFQPRAVPAANALIAAVHHNEMNWPVPRGIDLRYQYPLAAPASVLVTCSNDQDQSSKFRVKTTTIKIVVRNFVAVTASQLNRLFGVNRGTERAGDRQREGRSRSFPINDRRTAYRGLITSFIGRNWRSQKQPRLPVKAE